MGVERDCVEVRDGDRPALPGRAADEGLVEADPDRAQLLDDVRLGVRYTLRTRKQRSLLGVLHDRAAVGPRELDGVLGDGRQHLVDVEARADRLADLAQGLELLHLRGQLAPRASSSWTSLTVLTAIAAWAANAETIVLSLSSNGPTSLRHRLSAPTTSPSRTMGAPITVR